MPAAPVQAGPPETWYSFVDYFLDQYRLWRGFVTNFVRRLNSRRRLLTFSRVITQNPADQPRWANLVTDPGFRYEPDRRIDRIFDAYATTADGCDCVANLCSI